MTNLRNIFILFTALILAACGQSTQRDGSADGLQLEGAWVLRRAVTPMGTETVYPVEGRTLLRVYGDSTMCQCRFMDGPNGMTVAPIDTAVVTLIDKGGGDYLYFENNEPMPLKVVNDSTITIQRWGVVHSWVRERGISDVRIAAIRRLVSAYGLDYDNPSNYVFSEAEEALKEENGTLTAVIAAIFVVLISVVFLARDAIMRRRAVERQLRQLTDEREQRPQAVTDALKSVESEFFGSEYYKELSAKISKGKLSAAEWREAAQRIDGVYPGFTSKLTGLAKMSDTELRTCLLLKLRMSPSEIAAVLCRETSSVSSIRARLFQKVFSRKGSAKEWDEFILSL